MSRSRTTKATLIDADSTSLGSQKVIIELTQTAICIRPEGYGDCGSADGYGCPILLERHKGRLRLIVWSDINQQEPQIIDLEGAREDQRSPY